jgi:hypothetical protein
MPKELKTLNFGFCPHCKSTTHFKIFDTTILVCVLCDGTVKQYVNGSIKYEKVDTTILTGGVYPIIPEEDEDDF